MMDRALVEGFLLGTIATCSLASGVYFLRFWRNSRDTLFLCFAIAFMIEGLNRGARLFFSHPNEASPWVFVVRAIAFLIILAGIVNKNRQSSP